MRVFVGYIPFMDLHSLSFAHNGFDHRQRDIDKTQGLQISVYPPYADGVICVWFVNCFGLNTEAANKSSLCRPTTILKEVTIRQTGYVNMKASRFKNE